MFKVHKSLMWWRDFFYYDCVHWYFVVVKIDLEMTDNDDNVLNKIELVTTALHQHSRRQILYMD